MRRIGYCRYQLFRQQFSRNAQGGNDEILYFGRKSKKRWKTILSYVTKSLLCPVKNPLSFITAKKAYASEFGAKDVKKYIDGAVPLKNISPHKLRSTFGTNLYRETGDIYLVADVLGHKDVNTTRKHYAAGSEELRKAAAKNIKLR